MALISLPDALSFPDGDTSVTVPRHAVMNGGSAGPAGLSRSSEDEVPAEWPVVGNTCPVSSRTPTACPPGHLTREHGGSPDSGFSAPSPPSSPMEQYDVEWWSTTRV